MATTPNSNASTEVEDVVRYRDTETWHHASYQFEKQLRRVLRRSQVSRRLPPSMDDEDLHAEVLARIILAMRRHHIRAIWQYALRVADHCVADAWRTRRVRERELGSDADSAIEAATNVNACTASGAARIAEILHLERQHAECLLTHEQRMVYTLHREGFSHVEIAAAIGRKRESTVRVILHRARKILRPRLVESLQEYA